jgi:hypothetical protein
MPLFRREFFYCKKISFSLFVSIRLAASKACGSPMHPGQEICSPPEIRKDTRHPGFFRSKRVIEVVVIYRLVILTPETERNLPSHNKAVHEPENCSDHCQEIES